MTISSSWLLDSGQTRQDTRLSPVGVFTPTSPLATRSGVVPGSADGTTRFGGFDATGTGMTFTVFPGRAVIQTSDLQGAYPVTLTDQVTLTVPDGDQQPRIDLIVLRVYDTLFDASGLIEATIELVPGAAAASPQPPQLPPGSLSLYQILVPAGASAATTPVPWATAVTGQRTATVAAGGILPVTTDTSPGAYPGQYRDAGGGLQRWDGTAWQPYPPVPAWQDWTPQWTTDSGTSLPSWGNAVLTCRYVQYGPIVHLAFKMQFGSTTTFGASGDNWRFSLPVPAASTSQCIGFAEANASSSSRVICRMKCTTTDVFQLDIDSGRVDGAAVTNVGIVDSISPWIWAANGVIQGVATYEAAA